MTPALDHRSAARILDLADPTDASSGPRKAQAMAATVLLFAISAIAAHATVAGGSPTAALGADSFSARVGRAHAAATQESSHMHRLMAVAASGAVAMGSSAFAQDAVQWRVEDGGNGHWYGVSSVAASWQSSQDWCVDRGGHLATCTTLEEWSWVKSSLPVIGCFVGGYQERANSDYLEPAGGWRWVTGEDFLLDRFIVVDDCPGGVQGLCGCGTPGAQDVLAFSGCCDRILDDIGDGVVQNCDSVSRNAIIEYSADCNADGVVDYGQIRAGELDDANANNIPDCCEAGTACGCAADISGNGIVDAVDLAAVLSSWGNAPTGKTNADINRDGEIDAIDLAEVLSSWGTCP